MSDQLSLARRLLEQVLSLGPQKGARLKVLLAREFERRAGITFQRAFWNFPKFSAFLAANADLVEVVPPDGPGDITVQLRKERPPARPLLAALTPISSTRFLPAPLWNAFTNPDPQRRRFYHRVSREVVHYIEGSGDDPNPRIAAGVAADQNYVEIVPVPAEQQAAAMKDFLGSVSVPESKRALLISLAAMPYSSAVNTAFSATLGDYSESWRQFGAGRVQDVVRAWAESRGIGFDQLIGLPGPPIGSVAEPTPLPQPAGTPSQHVPASEHEFRRWLHTVIDSLDVGELGQILLPAATLRKLNIGRG